MGNLNATVQVSGAVGSSNVSRSMSKSNYLTGDALLINTQSLTTSESALELPDGVTDAGVLLLRNTDENNHVVFGNTGNYPFVLARDGGIAFVEVAESAAVYLKASTGTADVEIWVVESGGYPTTTTTTTTAAPTTTTTTTTL